MTRLRIMTYNVHRCVGRGGRDSIRDITEICAAARPDLIALQELDAPDASASEAVHHTREVAGTLGMTPLFCPTFQRGVGHYGHALLSRSSLEVVRVTTFSSHSGISRWKRGSRGAPEPRGAIWARARFAHHTVEIVSTHLGVTRPERLRQSTELLGRSWLGSPEMGSPRILFGDLNAIPNAATYQRFARQMRDAQRVIHGQRPKPTFPSSFPFLRLDHVFISDDIRVRKVTVPDDARARRASDHLPLIVDLELD